MSDLRPERTVQKALLSAPCPLPGEYVSEDLLVTHAFETGPTTYAKFDETPFARSYFVATFRTEDPANDGGWSVHPGCERMAEILASLLAVLFGKACRSHGIVQRFGAHFLPQGVPAPPTGQCRWPVNNHSPRKCVPTPLCLEEIARLERILAAVRCGNTCVQPFLTACQFYARALAQMETRPELAYLDLVMAGEVIYEQSGIAKEELLDCELRRDLSQIENGLEGGSAVVSRIMARLYQTRQGFARALGAHLDGYFYEHHEALAPAFALSEPCARAVLKAAYDLRSHYLHTGERFDPAPMANANEVGLGYRGLPSKKTLKTLRAAPTITGLERVLRYALLRIATEHGASLQGLTQPGSGADQSSEPAQNGGDDAGVAHTPCT